MLTLIHKDTSFPVLSPIHINPSVRRTGPKARKQGYWWFEWNQNQRIVFSLSFLYFLIVNEWKYRSDYFFDLELDFSSRKIIEPKAQRIWGAYFIAPEDHGAAQRSMAGSRWLSIREIGVGAKNIATLCIFALMSSFSLIYVKASRLIYSSGINQSENQWTLRVL